MANPFEPYRPPTAVDQAPAASVSTAVPDTIVALLAQTRPWVKLISVLTFISLPLLFLMAVGLTLATGLRTAGTFIPLIIPLLVYVPAALFLWRYARSIRLLQNGGGQAALESALSSQKSFWKYLGILACVMMAIYGVAIVGSVIFRVFDSRS
jgi:hypothetical protein